MLGTERCEQARRALCRGRSPTPPFGNAGSMLPGAPAEQPARNRCLATAFHSPATAARIQATIAGLKIPACRVGSAPTVPEARSARRSVAPASKGRVGINAACPLLRFPSALPACCRLPLPFRAFDPSGLKRSTGSPRGSPPSGSAAWPFAPRRRPYK